MRLIPVAMIWETLHRGRWLLILGILTANLLPTILFSAFSRLGIIEFEEPFNRTIHSTLMQLNMFIFGAAILAAQGAPSRLYAYPIPTVTLVAWHIIIAMFLMGAESLISLTFLNGVFQVGWPVWGPTVFVIAALTAVQASIWYTEKTAWLPLAMCAVAGGLGYWYFRRFSQLLTHPNSPILEVAPVEVVILVIVVFASYFVGVAGVSRNRCGEPIKPLGIVAWIERILDFEPVLSPPFRSRFHAQYWYEWTLKGWGMPVITVCGIFIVIGAWTLFSRNPPELVEAFVNGGPISCVVGMVIGMIIGNVGPVDSNFQVGQFLSTRPLTTPSLASTILKMAANSVLISWAIWIGAFAIVAGILKLSGFEPHPFFPDYVHWWHFPATLLACWTVTTTVASLIMTGRAKALAQIASGLLMLYIGLVIYANFALSWDARMQFFQGLAIAVGIGFVLCSVCLYIAAGRRRLITAPTIAIAAGVWMALTSAILFEWSRNRYEPASTYILVIGIAALTVLPFASAPLALSWNRIR